jgi:hypothetical protein
MTVVVGARRSEGSPDACLAALAREVRPGVEVILAADAPEVVPAEPPAWLRAEVVPGALVPELWAAGIARARGPLVGLLAATVVPDPGWVEAMLGAHADGVAGVGGPVEPGPGMRFVDWAVCFTRYAAAMLPLPAGAAPDVAGDNACYRAEVLAAYRDRYREGFFEPFVHRAMRADGHALLVRPDVVVRHRAGARIGAFSRQRFAHGRVHGEMRSRGEPPWRVAVGCLTAPLVPVLMATRAARHVAARRRHRARFVAALPLVLWFYVSWAAGELAGRIRALRRRAGEARR